MGGGRYLTAGEAAEELGISRATLYAYVSRGMVRSEAAGGRGRRYRADDVRALRERGERRRDPERAVEGALHWGAPVLGSGITLVAGGRLYYRGRDVEELVARHGIEEVAALIWTGGMDRSAEIFAPGPAGSSGRVRAVVETLEGLPPVEMLQAMLPVVAAEDPTAYDLRCTNVVRTGARMLRRMAGAVSGGAGDSVGGGSGRTVAGTLARGWCPGDSAAAALIDAALVLCADHELPVSTFAARCVASSGASPYAVVQAGLAALGGVRHGGQVELVEAFLREVAAAGDPRRVIAGRLRRGDGLPGFGHVLYPDGDPRGDVLLRRAAEAYPASPAVARSGAVADEVLGLTGERPNVDLALATVAGALGLPPGGAVALFALGRTVGWIGHAVEQYADGSLIRPRARYTGSVPPEDGEDYRGEQRREEPRG